MVNHRGALWRILRSSPVMRIGLYFFALAIMIIIYTHIFHLFYPLFEGKPVSWPASLLFVIETMTTVGFGDLLPFSSQYTILLTIAMIISGVMMFFIAIPLLLAPYLTTLLAPSPPRRTPRPLAGHVIIVGYGEIAKSLMESLKIADLEIVIVEKDEERAFDLARWYRRQAYVICGDLGNPATWTHAWAATASHIIICEDEKTAASIILGIRDRTKAKLVAVVDKLSFDRYIRYAGADYVLSPKHSTGRILARRAILNPHSDMIFEIPGLDRLSINIQDLETRELRLINIPIVTGCRAAGKTIRDIRLFEDYQVSPLFVLRPGRFLTTLTGDEILDEKTTLFLIGRADALSDAVSKEFLVHHEEKISAVIAGYGDVGASAYQELVTAGVSCTVVDWRDINPHTVTGDAQDEAVLTQAGIADAQFCVVALNDDDVNIFTTLMARNLNPTIRILARANGPGAVDKLYRAGADYVALLPTIGGQNLARIVLADIATVILDLPNGDAVIMKQILKPDHRTVGSIEQASGVRVIGIEDSGRQMARPPTGEPVRKGDTLIVVGNLAQLRTFVHL